MTGCAGRPSTPCSTVLSHAHNLYKGTVRSKGNRRGHRIDARVGSSCWYDSKIRPYYMILKRKTMAQPFILHNCRLYFLGKYVIMTISW